MSKVREALQRLKFEINNGCHPDDAIHSIDCILAEPEPAGEPVAYTYKSTQATICACCGEHKHTPLRVDAMGGYVCLTCINAKLCGLLGEFGYTKPQPAGGPVAWRINRGNGVHSVWVDGLPIKKVLKYWQEQGAFIEYAYTHPTPEAVRKLVEDLNKVAVVAHFGGLIDLSENEALTLVRKLTIKHHDWKQSNSEIRSALAEVRAEQAKGE